MSSVSRVGEALHAALAADTVAHRPNHAGAGRLSFAVARGADRFWARVAADDAEHRALLRWAVHADLLAERYAAPPVLEVLTVEGRAGLLFPFLDAPVATRDRLADRADDVLAVLADLHADAGLAESLGPPTTAGHSFTQVWLTRLEADLAVVEGYVAPDVHAWMVDEVDVLADLVAGPAFAEPVRAPVHGDPWHENLLLGPDRFWLLDWEDLTVGDPVVDDAILLADACGPEVAAWHGRRPARDPDEADRLEVACRALMLDAVVDVAADWVENHDPVVRQAKERGWQAALEAYRTAYP